MKYKLNIQKKSGFVYQVIDGVLNINDISIEEPEDTTIIDFDIPEELAVLGVTKCYRKDNEVICNLTLFVEDLEPYKTYTIKEGKSSSQKSKWDFSKFFTPDEILYGNIITVEGAVDEI